MAKIFYASARFRMALPEGISGVGGGLIISSGVPMHTLLRRDLDKKYPHMKNRMLDPQLYLGTLDANTCEKACVNLASYPWFLVKGFDKFDSDQMSQAEWRAKAKRLIRNSWRGKLPSTDKEIATLVHGCLEVQRDIGCEALILPAPLTSDPGTDYSSEEQWLDIGMKIAEKLAPDLKRLPTIALSDTCLRGINPWKNKLIDVLLDVITSRKPEGAYVVIEQANENGYYCTHRNTVGSLLRVVDGLRSGGIEKTVVSFAGMAGLLSLVAGADCWSTGWYRGERRLKLSDFEQHEGRAVPAFYSHPLASEIHVASDLDRIVKAGFLGQISDQTPSSRELLRALGSGHGVNSVPDWRYRLGNVQASIAHYMAVVTRETKVLNKLSPTDAIDYGKRWLAGAQKLTNSLYAVGSFNARTELSHQAGWQEAFNEFLVSR